MWWIESNSSIVDFPPAPLWDMERVQVMVAMDNISPDPMDPARTAPVNLNSPENKAVAETAAAAMAAAPVATTTGRNGYDSRMREPTTKLNRRQLFHMFVTQGIFGMLIAGVINFAIGYPIYSTPRAPPGPPPLGSPPPFLFRLPTSLLADAALTTIIQSQITWFCLIILVNRALSCGEVPPFFNGTTAGAPGAEPRGGFIRWLLFLDHYNARRGSVFFSGRFWGEVFGLGGRVKDRKGKGKAVVRKEGPAASPASMALSAAGLLAPSSSSSSSGRGFGWWLGFVLAGAGRAVFVAALGYAVMVGPTIGVLVACGTPYDGDWVFLGRWDGTVFKAVYGAVLAFVLGPPLAFLWIQRAGWIARRHEAV